MATIRRLMALVLRRAPLLLDDTVESADLTGAILTNADLTGVDLRYVRGLTRRQLQQARTDDETRWPLQLRE